jgi:catechol 2,3-dioxygenase-like lactoylglutathione lyase family enzyme
MADHPQHAVVAIVPCTDIDASTAFYARLGLEVFSDHGRYRILTDGKGWQMHLSSEGPPGWVVPGQNPNGLYLYVEDVDAVAARISDLLPGGGPSHRPWGMYEVSVSDPDGTLVRIGWPSRLKG